LLWQQDFQLVILLLFACVKGTELIDMLGRHFRGRILGFLCLDLIVEYCYFSSGGAGNEIVNAPICQSGKADQE